MGDQLEIEATDVIKIMLQFCKEHGMHRSFEAIQEDCQVSLNTVDNVDTFLSDVSTGRWDVVLPQIAHLRLPTDKLYDLYEQVVLEMIELRESDTARAMLRSMQVFKRLQKEDSERYMNLDRLCNRTYFDVKEVYGSGTKDKRRAQIAHGLAQEVTAVPPSRLMNIIGDALRWRRHLGTLPSGVGYDLLHGAAHKQRDEIELYPTALAASIEFGKASHAECAAFSPDGTMLVTGSVDGFVEVWDATSGKLKKDLPYQAADEMMMHEKPVLCVAVSKDSAALATGSQGGEIKVWKISSGRCIQRFDKAHADGVTSVAFSKDSSHVLSGSFDGAVRVHGLRSGKSLKEFRGHQSYVNCVLYSLDNAQVYSASSDGTVRVWDHKSCECLHTFRPPNPEPTELVVNSIHLHPLHSDQLIVCSRSSAVHAMTVVGQVVKSWSSGRRDEGGNFVAAAVAPRGGFLYCLGEDGNVYCFNVKEGRLDHLLPAHGAGTAIGVVHHPLRNVLATVADEPEVKIWKAS